ncbi:hypothetical protein Tco_0058565 [Tanacetum coccineum]
MVINSPCLIDKKELAIPGQMTTVNDGEQQLTVIVDGQTIAITEVFDQLTLMGGRTHHCCSPQEHTSIASQPTSQPITSQPMSSQEQPSQVPITEPITNSFTTSHPTQTPSPMPYDSPLSGVTSLEDDLKQTKKIYGKALTKLVKKVKHLEAKLKSTTERRKARMIISDDEEDLVSEDTSKQGRITEIENEGFTLQQFTPTKVTQGEEQCQESFEAQLSVLIAAKILADASREKVKTYSRRRSTDSLRDSTAGGLFSTAEEVQDKEQISTDKKEMARAAAREEQERIDFKKALELQKQLDEREETDNIDWNIVVEQVQERQSDNIKRYQTLKKKPVSVAQARKNMMIYLKNMAGYKMSYFKGMSYDEIRPIFEEEFNKIQTLFKKDTEVKKTKT